MKFMGTDELYAEAVRHSKSPADAAEMGRSREKPLRSDWEEVKYDVMMKALVAKYTQDKDAYEDLLASGERLLVEHTENDRVWGDAEDGSGTSWLGKALMEIRHELRSGH